MTDVLLIGGGVASASAAAELRALGFDGSIVLATRELDAPYHRPPITKQLLCGSCGELEIATAVIAERGGPADLRAAGVVAEPMERAAAS